MEWIGVLVAAIVGLAVGVGITFFLLRGAAGSKDELIADKDRRLDEAAKHARTMEESAKTLQVAEIELRTANKGLTTQLEETRGRLSSVEAEIAAARKTASDSAALASAKEAEANQLNVRLSQANGEITTLRQRSEILQTEVNNSERKLEQLEQDVAAEKKRLEDVHAEKVASLAAQKDAFEKAINERNADFEKQKEALKASFAEIAGKALGDSSKQFLELAEQNLGKLSEAQKAEMEKKETALKEVLKPLDEQLKEYKAAQEKLRDEQREFEQTSKNRLEQLLAASAETQKTTQQMQQLFKGGRTRGKVGEVILEQVLVSAGLTKGQNFTLQSSQAVGDDEESVNRARKMPDCLVHLPDGRVLVIDSKAPFDAYQRACDSTDDLVRGAELKRHCDAVRAKVRELVAKDYQRPDNCFDYVVMFIPIESALTEAITTDSKLYDEAWQQRVVLCTPSTLLLFLSSVASGWRSENIMRNAESIQKVGETMLERIQIVASHLAKLGKSLNDSTEAYNKTLASVERNLFTAANDFKKLGLKDKRADRKLPAPAGAHASTFSKPELVAASLRPEEDVPAFPETMLTDSEVVDSTADLLSLEEPEGASVEE